MGDWLATARGLRETHAGGRCVRPAGRALGDPGGLWDDGGVLSRSGLAHARGGKLRKGIRRPFAVRGRAVGALATVVALGVSPLVAAPSASAVPTTKMPTTAMPSTAMPSTNVPTTAMPTQAVAARAGLEAPASSSATPRWAEYFAQRPAWRNGSCSRDVTRMADLIADVGTRTVVECTRVRTPLVWSDLSKGYGYLQVSRVRRVKAARDTRPTRLLFVNPGGPGVTADWLAPTVAALEPTVHASHDIVAVDARGTGGSLPVACSTVPDDVTDYRTPTTSEVQAQQRAVQRTVTQCTSRFGRTLPHLNTLNTVRDHDLVRSVLGHQVVDFYGVSAGTWMAARYADLFPARVGRFVLDSNTQLATDWRRSFAYQPQGFQRRFERQFLPWTARRHADFGLGSTTTAVRATYNRLRSAAQAGRYGALTPQLLDDRVVEKLYSDVGFAELADDLAELAQRLKTSRTAVTPRAAAAPGVAVSPGAATAASYRAATPAWVAERAGAVGAGTEDTVFMAVQCNDSAWVRNPASYVAEGLRLGAAFPLLGYAWVTSPCAYWPYAPSPVPRTKTAKRAPMLMVQSELDPATPYEGAVAAHRARPETRLVSVQDQGNHGVWLGENPCVEKVVGTYLATGRLPARDLVCSGVALPADDRAYPVESPLPSSAGGVPPAPARPAPKPAPSPTPKPTPKPAPKPKASTGPQAALGAVMPGLSAAERLAAIERAMRAATAPDTASSTVDWRGDSRLDPIREEAQRRLARGLVQSRISQR